MHNESLGNAQLKPSLKHSEFGIGALILAAMNVIGLVLIFGLPAVMHLGKQDISGKVALLFCSSFFASFLFSMLGVLVGLVGVFQPGKKKTMAFIGLGINVLSSLVAALMFVYVTVSELVTNF